MSFGILLVFALLVVAVALFATEWVSFDITALVILCTLAVSGVLTVRESFSGFSNEATLTIAAMFVLAEGVRRTGALDRVGEEFCRLAERRPHYGLAVMMLVVAVISAFINNTAAIAIFIPVALEVARTLRMSPSKILMPLSFASMFGGVCTLLGTSTNILVSSIAEKRGEPAFGMFEFAPLGLVFGTAGFLYLFTLGRKWIPARRTEADLTRGFELQHYITDVVLEPGGEHIGEPLEESTLTEDLDLDVLHVFRREREHPEEEEARQEGPRTVLEGGDILRIRGSAEEIRKLVQREDVVIRPAHEWADIDLRQAGRTLVEAVIAPESPLEGQEVRNVDLDDRFGAVVLALRHRGEIQKEDLGSFRLTGGDSLLLALDADRVQEVERDRSFVLVSEVGLPEFRRNRIAVAVLILAGVVGTAAAGLVPIVVSAVTGALLMVLFGCLTSEEAYQAVNWKVILLLAGVLPLGTAMDKTGAAGLLSDLVLSGLGPWGPAAVLSGFFLLSMLLTNVISNQATAALLAPIAFQAASGLAVSPRPFLMAVTYAASLSFMTPVGYQTNTLIYGPGQYKFSDFFKVGTPLNLLLWLLATLCLPWIWEL